MAAMGTRAADSDAMKNRRRTTIKARHPSAPKVSGRRKPSSTNVNTKIALLKRERDEALEREKATAEVLRVISSSPGELKPVFQAMLENATHICEAKFGILYRFDGEALHLAAGVGLPPELAEFHRQRGPFQPRPGTQIERVVRTKQVGHTADADAAAAADTASSAPARFGGARTIMAVPMLKDDALVGVISIYRQEVRPFTDKQITLVTNFAAQAVIAIENTRLLNELRESLQQQTATADVLKVISSSPGELELVFQAMLENATRICEAKFGTLFLYEGGAFRSAALHNAPPALAEFLERGPIRPGPNLPLGQVAATKQVSHIADVTLTDAYISGEPLAVAGARLGGYRTVLTVPMLKDNEFVGAIVILRQEVQPFTDKQIALVQNFAAQAVIAIENTRLLNELRESLEQQTATSEVLSVISSSPGELEPVFQAMLGNATQLCEAKFGSLFLRNEDGFCNVAIHGAVPAHTERWKREPVLVLSEYPNSPLARLAQSKEIIHITDVAAEPGYIAREPRMAAMVESAGARTILIVPMLKDDELTGAIGIFRQDVRPFTDKQIELVQNFAAQAVIAIENTRLLNELRQRTDDLTESLEQQTATSEVLSVISSSPSELGPVFQTVLENATRLCEANFGTLNLNEGGDFPVVAMHNAPPAYAELRRREPAVRPGPDHPLGRVAATKQVLQIADMTTEVSYRQRVPSMVALADLAGARTLLIVPMLKESEVVGVITIYRQEVRPFTDKQIELVQNFAAQAVIAIENTRLLNELRESLQQQTATSEVLSVISSSPGELEPVFNAMLENAVRICEAKFGTLLLREGDAYRGAAEVGTPPGLAEYNRRGPFQAVPGSPLDHVTRTKQVSHVADAAAEAVLIPPARLAGARTVLIVPMLKDNALIGAITVYRQEVRPFTDKQIALVQNFAAQAVIAIENTRLLNELRQRTTDLTESLEQQTATSEVLGVISSSPGDLQPIFATILENATRICAAKFGTLFLSEGNAFRVVAMHNAPTALAELRRRQPVLEARPGMAYVRSTMSKRAIQIADITEDQAYFERDPIRLQAAELGGYRAVLSVPMLKDNESIGAFNIYRQEPGPFTDKQIALATTFAAQAVIAIENTRLLNELRQRTDDLTESLEQQTATAEVLRVISASPGDLQPVFVSMLENAVRICDASFGNFLLFENGVFRHVALHNAPKAWAADQQHDPIAPRRSARLLYRVAETKQVTHIADMASENPEEPIAKVAGARTVLIVPMLKEAELIGVIAIYRQEVRPFTNRQIELLANFAAQAVIAIENTRLLNELRHAPRLAVEQQRRHRRYCASSSSSPGELEPVFQAMLENATHICGAKLGHLFRVDGMMLHLAAQVGNPPELAEFFRRRGRFNRQRAYSLIASWKTKQTSHIADDAAEAVSSPPGRLAGARSVVAVPMLKDDELIGIIVIYRQEVRPFTDKQIDLVKNFAAQAVIAIENTRLLNELRESLEQQTATADVLKVISRSTFDLQAVLDTLVELRLSFATPTWPRLPGCRGQLIVTLQATALRPTSTKPPTVSRSNWIAVR